jgi:hypothetical protein
MALFRVLLTHTFSKKRLLQSGRQQNASRKTSASGSLGLTKIAAIRSTYIIVVRNNLHVSAAGASLMKDYRRPMTAVSAWGNITQQSV